MSKTLSEITKISKDRAEKYGPARGNFQDTADLWNAYLGTDITAEQVGVMMALVKIARMKTSGEFHDHYVDAANYLVLSGDMTQEGKGIVGEKLDYIIMDDFSTEPCIAVESSPKKKKRFGGIKEKANEAAR